MECTYWGDNQLQKHKSCPYYRGGFCVSPLLGAPSDLVTSAERCTNNYTACRFFTEEVKQGLELHMTEANEIKFYSKVNIIPEDITSDCSFFVASKSDKGKIARCKALGRTLTVSQALLCHTNWQNCPFRSSFSLYQA